MPEETLLWQFVTRLRPAIKQMDVRDKFMAYLTTLPVLLMGPFAIAGIIALVAVTEWSQITGDLALLALLLAVLLLIHARNYTLHVETRSGNLIPMSGSLDTIVAWSGLLILGPVALWTVVLDHAIRNAYQAIVARRMNRQPQAWMRLSLLSQELGGLVFSLIGLALYRALGGTFPLEGFALADWGPALAAVMVSGILGQVLFFPLLRAMTAATGQEQANTISLLILLTTFMLAPFGVFGALVYSAGTPGLYVLYMAGIVLVNMLAYYLSRTNERSQQRARELARLEELGEALIQAPPDLSALEDVLREHISVMFPQDRIEIRLIPPPDAASSPGVQWPALTLTYPPNHPPLSDAEWSHLHGANQTEITLHNVAPPGSSVRYGDALIVPIATDDPGAEGGAKERLLGGIALLRHHTNGKTAHSLAALQALASQIASAYYRAHVHRETLAAQKMVQELEFAGYIQATFLPDRVPEVAGWDIAAGLAPARQTSGDFYDFVPLANGRVGIVVADVADKGTGAALYMALSRTLLRTFAAQHPDAPERALQATNERLLTDAESDQFVTVFYGVLAPDTGTLTYANAGHNPGFVLRANGSSQPIATLTRTGLPLGIFEGMAWKRESVTLAAGDVLVLYTDGVSEAQNSNRAEYGEQRLCDTVHAHCPQTADAILAAVTQDVQAFTGDAAQFDDITLLVAVRKSEG